MSKQKVFLIGATGETGGSILEALVEDGSFDITCFIRTASAGKPAVQQLRDRGLHVVTGDFAGPIEDVVPLLRGIDTVISIVFPPQILEQIPMVNAAVQAGVKRFVPCNWGTPVARGGIMGFRDIKEEVHDHMFRQRLGFTIIEVGFWYESGFPLVPSGKFDYASFVNLNQLIDGGTAPNMLMSKRDVGRITARIVKDDCTLNKRVYAYGDVLSQNEIHAIIERKTGEKIEAPPMSAEEVIASIKSSKEAAEADPTDRGKMHLQAWAEYLHSKYVRADNTPENAEYLGHISARELFPDFEYMKFDDFIDELIAGRVTKIYQHVKV